jgi:hypothetical protein
LVGSINSLPFDHKSGSPESQSRLLPDINKSPIVGDPPPTLCDTCSPHDEETPSVRYIELRLDYRELEPR